MTRVAVADDDHDLRALIADLLRERGFDVVEAADGATLLAMLHRGDVSLVVTDLWMPRLTGSDVLQLRRSSGDKTPFIVITAAPSAIADPLLQNEWVTVVHKPFTEEMILRAVTENLVGEAAALGTPPAGLTTIVASPTTVADAAKLDRAQSPQPSAVSSSSGEPPDDAAE